MPGQRHAVVWWVNVVGLVVCAYLLVWMLIGLSRPDLSLDASCKRARIFCLFQWTSR